MKQSGISFLVTNEEFLLLERIVYLEPGIYEVLDKARDEDGLVRLKMIYDDLGECLEALSYEAIQNDSPKDELIALYKKLAGYGKLREHFGKHAKVLPKKPIVDDVYIFDVQVIRDSAKARKVIRTIAISGKKSLYQFAGTIVRSFDFFFDHCFAFYGDVDIQKRSSQKEIYELFVDIGEEPTAPHAQGVKKPKVSKVFTSIGKTMLFFFDYGDNWNFSVELKEIRKAGEGEKLPRVLNAVGKAPLQYPSAKDF